MTITIRAQTPADIKTIEAINAAAFKREDSGGAFDVIRRNRKDIVSIVALHADQVVGHVLFSPAILATTTGEIQGMGLGQLAVEPRLQNQGIGTLLSEHGIDALRRNNCPFVIVVGHASYYPRFGFEPGHLHGIQCQWEGIPANNFMVLFPCGKQPNLVGLASFVDM